jgi:gliding motility-associated-like protein
MYVFNRWGEEVFYTNNVDNSWDGTIEGKEAPLEVYVWKIHLFDQTGEPRTYRGRVTLFR